MATGADAGVIKGKLTDSQNEPLIGASVVVKGAGHGTVTDMDGNYEINNPLISYPGYEMGQNIRETQGH